MGVVCVCMCVCVCVRACLRAGWWGTAAGGAHAAALAPAFHYHAPWVRTGTVTLICNVTHVHVGSCLVYVCLCMSVFV
jgi:hypothetical protein